MTNLEYLKTQSAEWLAAKLVKRMNCSLCPVVDECIEMAKILGELKPSECRKMLENWLNAERTEGNNGQKR